MYIHLWVRDADIVGVKLFFDALKKDFVGWPEVLILGHKAYCKILSRWSSSWQCGEPDAHMKWWFPTGLQSEHNEYYYRAYFINTTLIENGSLSTY